MDFVVNVIVAIDDFKEETGATVVIPGSHRWERSRLPQDSDRKVQLTTPAGGAYAFSGKLWHGGGANITRNEIRRGLLLIFQQPWLRTLENHVNFLFILLNKNIILLF